MELARKNFGIYLDSAWNKSVDDVAKAVFQIIGVHMEELTVDLNYDKTTVKNVLGETRVVDNGASPSINADPFRADTSDLIYPHLRDIALDRKTGDAKKTLMLEVWVEEEGEEEHIAYLREVMVTPDSYGGGTDGINIPFTIEENGRSVKGTVTAASVKERKPVFTAESTSLSD